MQVFGEGLGEPVGQGLDHDGVVVVVVLFELPHQLIHTDAGGHCKHADVVRYPRLPRRDEIGQRQIRPVVRMVTSCCRSIGNRASSFRRESSV